VEGAGAREDVTGARPRVCPGVAALGRVGRSTHPAPTPCPLAAVSPRGARRKWGDWNKRDGATFQPRSAVDAGPR
jgi:hypothetical protein